MQSVSPVFTDEEVQLEFQTVKTDSKYIGVIGLPVTLAILDPKTGESKTIPNWAISTRYRLTPEERAQIAAGLDIVVTQLTFGKPFVPMNLQLCPAKTKPIFEEPPTTQRPFIHEWEPDFSEGEPARDSKVCGVCGREDDVYHSASKVIEMPQGHGKTAYSVPDATGLADICPSCGATERTEESQQRSVSGNACANAWHGAEDQPQSGV